MKLSDRLQYIADQIVNGETMADIGTDHGFLPIYLLERGICPRAILADISKGSLKKAEENCKAFEQNTGRHLNWELRLGDGIDVLEDGEADAVVMAGIGGQLMCEILDWNCAKSRSMKRYILQPRNHPGLVRKWLYEHGFAIVREGLVREGKYICEILTVESGPRPENVPLPPEGGDAAFAYPNSILRWRDPLAAEYLRRKLELEREILLNISTNSQNPEQDSMPVKNRIRQILYLLEELEDEK